MKPGVKVRATAAGIIAEVLRGKALDAVFEQSVAKVQPRDQALCRELCYGTLRWYPRLNALLNRLLDKPLKKGEFELQALALMGLYQLSGMRIPAHAAVSATVDAAAAIRKRRMGGLLNAVLRRYQRESNHLEDSLSESERMAQPAWLWQALGEQWPEQRQQIALASNTRPPMTLRVNLKKTSRQAYLAALDAENISATPGLLAKSAVTLSEPCDVSAIPGFFEGLCSVQDEAAQLATIILNPQPGELVLDACAAPGGKTGHILEASGADVTAIDVSAVRLELVDENLQRLSLSARLITADASAPPEELAPETFDAVLVDAPCSATGVIRRHPDIKVLRRESDAPGFAEQQIAILEGLWPVLKPGGRLLYVTCSILREENADVVARFGELVTDAEVLAISFEGTADNPLVQPTGLGVQVLPSAEGSDGLFFSLLQKKPVHNA